MSRIGKQPVIYPKEVKVQVDNSIVKVEGPKGKLQCDCHPLVKVQHDAAARKIEVTRRDDERLSRSVHGLTRSLIQNMVDGVTTGYQKRLKLEGVGYQ